VVRLKTYGPWKEKACHALGKKGTMSKNRERDTPTVAGEEQSSLRLGNTEDLKGKKRNHIRKKGKKNIPPKKNTNQKKKKPEK